MANTVCPLSPAAGIEVRKGSRPSGCPRPMRRSWLRRNRLQTLRHGDAVPEGHSLLSQFLAFPEPIEDPLPKSVNKKPHFFGEAPEQRPWAIKREDRPAAFCRALLFELFDRLRLGYLFVPTWASILSHLPGTEPAGRPPKYRNLTNSPENIVRMSGEDIEAHYSQRAERFRRPASCFSE